MPEPRSRVALHAALDRIQRRIEEFDATIERKYRADQLRDELGRFAYEGGNAAGGAGGGGDDPAHPKLRGQLGVKLPYTTDRPGHVISDEMHKVLTGIGEDYTAQTGDVMVVVSGTRSPQEEAAAMYKKFEGRADMSIYKDQRALGGSASGLF